MLIVLTLLVLIMIVLVFVPFNLKKHDVSYYVITHVCEKNNTIYALSDLRFCKAHNCFETQDILDQNKWESVIFNDSTLSKYKNLYFEDKKVLKEFKKLKKKFKIDCNEIEIKFYS